MRASLALLPSKGITWVEPFKEAPSMVILAAPLLYSDLKMGEASLAQVTLISKTPPFT